MSDPVVTAVVEPPKPAVVVAAPAPVVAAPPAAVPAPVVDPAPATTTAASTVSATASWAKPAVKDAAAPDPAKPADPKAAPAVKTDEFNLKAPEGVTLEPAVLEGYKTLSKDLGLTSEQAQKLYDRDLSAQKAAEKDAVAGLQKQDALWLGELQTKWGPKFLERSTTVSRAYDYADPTGEFRAKLGRAGLLNSPDLTEFVEKFGELFKEDTIPSGAKGVPKAQDTRPQQERLTEAFRAEAEKLKQKGKR